MQRKIITEVATGETVEGLAERLLLEDVAFSDSIKASRSSTAPPVEGLLQN